MWAIITLICLQMLGLGIIIANHGRETKYNALASTIGLIIQWTLLYFAGIFDKF